jgi:hypothetical protein
VAVCDAAPITPDTVRLYKLTGVLLVLTTVRVVVTLSSVVAEVNVGAEFENVQVALLGQPANDRLRVPVFWL